MTELTWVRSPVGSPDRHLATRTGVKSVLVMIPHIVAGNRLLDLLPLLEADSRLQVIFTSPEWESWRATHDFVAAQGGIVLPWAQARRGEYDLVLAASQRGIDEVTGPVLLIPHGGGFGQYRPWRPPGAGDGWRPQIGLEAGQLMREGRVRADSIVLVHDRERDVLAETCPRAVPAAVVAGDIALDRLTASLPFRDHYRRGLGVSDDRRLVVVTSTWSDRSAFGRHHDLFDRVIRELPPGRFRVLGVLHPQIWSHHGVWQVRAWLADGLRSGLTLLRPEGSWRAALIAADHVIGDYGSVTGYASGIGKPVLLAVDGTQPLLPGTPSAVIAEHAPKWDPGRPLVPQLSDAESAVPADRVRALLSSRQGRAGAILRTEMYRLLGLTEPARAVPVSPVPMAEVLPC
ncbi:hypothetical protein ACFQ05_25955 [Amycolatopsis umgeniensis]|uniref:CDP-Glycerol:Poly(Glycerophosphate) glycerophosphotransferase n=1 Tax=Amycolatopsis umgeniensis TaxID=336628 RepID=A0A841BCV2_9PSEU|nr:hypothetical protein [Amycolatopsis umgeniensis]MBB5856324.1 hypothetical protein [Amycolatopsis umgeniensis]